MSRKSIAAQVLLPGKLMEMRKAKEKFLRLKGLSDSVQQQRNNCPYTEENMDTLLTMGLAAILRHDLFMMIYWANIALEIQVDLESYMAQELRYRHQLNRLTRIAVNYSNYYQALGNEIARLQHDIKCG
ncbi:hypothetical protein D3C71_553400 [compost metagenome]